MPYRRKVEEDINHDRWLVSYADFITLLLAFFVVMYSVSQVNDAKFRVLSNTITDAFNLPEYELDPFQVGEVAKSNPLNLVVIEAGADTALDVADQQEVDIVEETVFETLTEQLQVEFPDQLKLQQIHIKDNGQWLELSLSSKLLFPTASADLDYEAEAIINQVAGVLFDFDNAIRVEGFTDNQQVKSARYASNWELSTARASSIVRQLVFNGIAPARLAAVGYGEHQPIADNNSDEGREQNRRVAILISKTAMLRPSFAAPNDLAPTADTVISEADAEIAPEPVVEAAEPGVRVINLDNGGVLFTNDPAR